MSSPQTTVHSPRALLLAAIICSLMLLIGCSPRYIPIPQQNIEISGDYAIMTLDNCAIAVSEALWTLEPQYLSNYYTTIIIRIQNKSKENIHISPTDFAIIDENSFQYDSIPSDAVLEAMLLDPSLIPDRFAIAVETQRENLARISEIRRNIANRGFSFGDIHTGAIKDGVLFFQKLDNKNKEFRFIYKSNEIVFRKG